MTTKLVFFTFALVPFSVFAQTHYRIEKGDTVLKIADKVIGTNSKADPRRYEYAKKVQKLNPEIKNLNQLEPGQTILIPTKDMPSFIDIRKHG